MSEIRPYFDYDSLLGKHKPRFGYVVKADPSPICENYVRITFDDKSFTDVSVNRIDNFFSQKSEEKEDDNIEACENILKTTKAHYIIFAILGIGITKYLLKILRITIFDDLIRNFVIISILFYLLYVNIKSKPLIKKYKDIPQQLAEALYISSGISFLLLILELL